MFLPVLLAAAWAHADLAAAATAAGRPPECIPVTRAQGSIWAMARQPKLARHCQLLARAQARLDGETDAALTAARAAEEVLPGRAAAMVAIGRAALRLGKLNDALAAFDEATKRDRRSFDSPLALRDLALARRQAGRLAAALDSYRVLVPLASLLPSRADRARVLLEAAHASMLVAAETPTRDRRDRTPIDLDEALAYLREAARDAHHPYRLDVALSLVLALDRAGKREQADALLSEQSSAAAWASQTRVEYLAAAEDREMLAALALEQTAPEEAARHYQAFLAGAGGKGPFKSSAAERLARLKPGRPERRPGRPR